MKKKEKINYIILLISIPLIIVVVILSRSQIKQFSRLEKEGVIDTAIIVRELLGAKGILYYEYVFYIKDKKLNGFLQYSQSFGAINVGDSFLVRYLPSSPDEINEPIIKNNYSLIKVGK